YCRTLLGSSSLSLHDALPILLGGAATALGGAGLASLGVAAVATAGVVGTLYYFDKNFKAGVDKFLFGITDAEQRLLKRITAGERSEEHTSELQSRENLVCRLL